MKKICPTTIWLTTNRNCNNHCFWCYAKDFRCKNIEMDFERLKETINQLICNGLKKVVLIGGEPTLYEKLFETICFLKEKNLRVSMASNGRRFANIEFSKKIAHLGIDHVDISIKGANESEYKKNTSAKGFNEMVLGFHNLKKLGVKVSTSYVLCNPEESNIDLLKESILKNKIDNINFQLYKPSVILNKNEMNISISKLAALCEYTYNSFKDTNLSFRFEMSIPLCALTNSFLEKLIYEKRINTGCHISKGFGMVFDTDFKIQPCNHFVNFPFNIEEITPNKILSYWNSDIPKAFRKRVSTYPSKKCVTCSYWEKCGGGCVLRWLHSKPEECIPGMMKGGDIECLH